MTTTVDQLHSRLGRMGLDALLFCTSEGTPSPNVRYLSGFTGSDAALLITRTERHLFTDGRYKTQAAQQANGFLLHIASNKLNPLVATLKSVEKCRLGVEASRVSYSFVTSLVRRLSDLEPVPLKRDFLDRLRSRKSPEEKTKIERAAEVASSACKRLIETGLRGRKESEVAAELETLFRQGGAEGIAFDTIVASGERSAQPHGKASDKVILDGELIVVDFGCVIDGYHSDETITCVTGQSSQEQQKIHAAVYEAHMRALEEVKPGMHVRAIDGVAREVIASRGFGKHFLHSLGHGVGLEIHEPPFLSPRGRGTLDEGMVFTIEPGVYLEGVGGVRLESLVYLDRSGPELLSRMTKDLIRVD